METIYKIYDLKKYYTNFVGANPIAVVSDLAEDELLVKCPELQSKRPFVLVTKSQWKEMKDIYDCFELDEEKHRIAALRHEEKFSYQEGQTELIMHEQDENPVMDEVLSKIALEQLHSAIEKLPECQRRRILKHYSGYTCKEIAAQEHVSKSPVVRAIHKGIKSIKKEINII